MQYNSGRKILCVIFLNENAVTVRFLFDNSIFKAKIKFLSFLVNKQKKKNCTDLDPK